MNKVICKNNGVFTINGKDIILNVGDIVPKELADAALKQGWGYNFKITKKTAK